MLDLLSALFRSLSFLWEMSVTAAYVVVVVFILRLQLKQWAPKQVLCLLWLVVFARLLIPVSLESPLSIVPGALPGQEYAAEQAPAAPGADAGDPVIPVVPQNPAQNQNPVPNQPQNQPGYGTVAPVISNQNPSLSIPEGVSPTAPARSSPTSFPWQAVIAGVWLTGAAVMGGCALVSWLRLRRRLYDAIRAEDGAWEHPAVDSPFILGVLRPRIYLPAGLTGQPRQFILCHERAHLRRFDHIVKPVCWIALAIHWFNPLAWAAFLLMSRDIESACDEAVVRQLGSEVKADYSYTLLALATGRRLPAPCPLAFDEGDAKGRIRNVLNYRRPAFWAIAVSVTAAVLAAVCLLTDPVAAKGTEEDPDPDATASHDPDAVTSQPPIDPADTLLDPWMVEFLDGERDFKTLGGKTVNIDWLNPAFYGFPEEMPAASVQNLAILDLDRDGVNELVICPADALPDDTDPFASELLYRVGYLILRRVGDEVYGYAPGYRSFEGIKADGTFAWYGGVTNYGTASLSFEGDQIVFNNITWYTSIDDPGVELYFVEGRKATQEEFEAAISAQNAKPEPTWYTYADGALYPLMKLLAQTHPDYSTGDAKLWLSDGSTPYLEWNGSTARLDGLTASAQLGSVDCRDFDGDGLDEVVISWYINGFLNLHLYEWEEGRPILNAVYDTQQLLMRFNQYNVAAYNKDSRGLSVTYAHTEGNDDDPDYYRHYVTGHTTLPENFFDGFENIRDGYTYAYAYSPMVYLSGLDTGINEYYIEFDFYLADETMMELDFVDVPLGTDPSSYSQYFTERHYMAYSPVGYAHFFLRYDGTDWRVQEGDELVMLYRNDESQTTNVLGFDLSRMETEEIGPFQHMSHFYVEMDGEDVCVAEQFGYDGPEVWSRDLDGDGVPELICNCTYGDGVQMVIVYRSNNGVIEKGTIRWSYYSEKFGWTNIGESGISGMPMERYDPERGVFTAAYSLNGSDDPATAEFDDGVNPFSFSPFSHLS